MNDIKNANLLEDMYSVAATKLPKPRRNRKNNRPGDLPEDLGACPRTADQVYSLGINIQYCVGDIYLELSRLNQGTVKNQFKTRAIQQLDGKNEIEKLANINLNKLLTYFYNNGGPVIEPPLTEQTAREIQPFFARITANFMKQLNGIAAMAAKSNLSAGDLDNMINGDIIDMYTTMSMFFPIDEIKDAFNDLIRVRENLSNK